MLMVRVDLGPVIDDIADRADDFLEGATSREQAQAGVSELITLDYPTLTAPQRTEVIKGVMAVLEEEGFFENMPKQSAADDPTASREDG